MAKSSPARWKEEPDEHDYPAAADYLELLLSAGEVVALVEGLRAAPLTTKKAKDLLRASRLPLLPGSDVHVREELGKIARNSKLSPVLLVRGALLGDLPLTVADGYHRICASYHLDEDADIPCRIADFPPARGATDSQQAGG